MTNLAVSLSVDEVFSIVGPEQFCSEWTGKESISATTLPIDYWYNPLAIVTLSDVLKSSRLSEAADWLSESYVDESAEDNAAEKAIERYKAVADIIIQKCKKGEYSAFLVDENNQLRDVSAQINNVHFRRMIYHPEAPSRHRLRLVPMTEPTEQRADVRANFEPGAERYDPTQRDVRKAATRRRYQTWYELGKRFLSETDGRTRSSSDIARKIARDPSATDPLTNRAPNWKSVLRRLNEHYPDWAKKN